MLSPQANAGCMMRQQRPPAPRDLIHYVVDSKNARDKEEQFARLDGQRRCSFRQSQSRHAQPWHPLLPTATLVESG